MSVILVELSSKDSLEIFFTTLPANPSTDSSAVNSSSESLANSFPESPAESPA